MFVEIFIHDFLMHLSFLIPSFLHLYMILMIVQECTNPRHLVSSLGDSDFTLVPHTSSIIIAFISFYMQ